MAETALSAPITGVGKWSTTGAAITMDSADVANGNKITAAGHVILVVHNTNAGAQTITVNSIADPKYGRTGDISAQSLAAGEIRLIELTEVGWEDANGEITFSASSADVKIGAYIVAS